MIKRFARWVLRDDVQTIDHARLRSGDDAVERGARWESFYREEGGLLDMLETERRELFEAAGALDPSDIGKVYWLATGDRIVRRLQARIEAIVTTGKIEAEKSHHLSRAEQLKRIDKEF